LENLLIAKTPTEVFNDKGLTPIWLAVFKNDTTSLKLLIKYTADINFLEKGGMHPIMIGCLANSFESVSILIDNGVDVNWKSKASRNQQPIRFASQGGSLKLVKLLLAKGADMDASPDDKATPLLASLHAMKFDIAEFYFTSGANVNVIGRDGECVIHEAIKTKNPKMVKLALIYKAPLDIKDPSGKTTLQLAKQTGNSEIKNMIKDAVDSK
jgi:ankyrin repeat protein